jgi:FkbM family methyltransferase
MNAKYLTFHGNDKEDQFLYDNFSGMPDKGVMVDIGAGPDGIQGSNSYFFEQNGWNVICVDADPRNVEKLQKNRKVGIGALVTNKEGDIDFYMNLKTPDISGIIQTPDNRESSVKIKGTKLEQILSDKNITNIDILSIDTEGSEIDVFESMDFEKHKPKILIIEVITQGRFNSDIQTYFENKGYHMVAEIGANQIFALKKPIVRNPHRIIYGSSYDRGLEHLLKMWPDIRKEIPDAELHIYYGWNLFDLGYSDNPERMAWKEKMNGLMQQDGITHLGRISHEAVIIENREAGIWAYPTHFGEISCITAMKAQAYGAIPVVVDYAAVSETVQHGIKVRGDIYDPETKEEYKKALISILKDTELQEKIRKPMMDWAKDYFAWSKVARQWDEEFKKEETVEDKAMKLILSDEPLQALLLLKEDSPLRQKLIKKLDHVFNPESYSKKYADDLMNWKPEIDTINLARHSWILEQAKDAKTLIDLGCYEGSLMKRFGKPAKGVEMCKEAVRLGRDRGLDIVQGDACVYTDNNKYDAVCACEVIEHVSNPNTLIENMLKLVSDEGWCYITTPNGSVDTTGTIKVWNDENALIDHVRTYTPDKINKLLNGLEYVIAGNDKELWVKFRTNLEYHVNALLEDNQALKAWEIVKNTNFKYKDVVWQKVKHAFNKKDYIKYYSKDLIENPVPEEICTRVDEIYPRFKWLLGMIEHQKPKSVIDLGCADGYTGLTLAKRGFKVHGVNLYAPSIKVANDRAKKLGLDATFEVKDLFDVKGTYDAIILFEVFEHLPDPVATIKHCMSLVNKNGSFYLSTPSPDSLSIKLHKEEGGGTDWTDSKPSGHLRIYSEEELRELLKDYKIESFYMDEHNNYCLEVKNV